MKPEGGWTDEFLDEMRKIGDPLADGTVDNIFERGRVEEVNRLFKELFRTGKVPDGFSKETLEYLKKSEELPEWADRKKIERGEEMYSEHGLLSGLILWYASLPECYALEHGASIIYLSGQLVEHTMRRVYTTARMLIPVMTKGGLSPNGEGIRQIQKVRLIHATIRHLILLPPSNDTTAQSTIFASVLENNSWNVESEGFPINQELMGYTLLTFGYVFLRSLKYFGVNWDQDDEEAYLHCWNVAGHIIGLRRDMMAETMDEAEELFSTIKRRCARQSDAGQALTKALLAAMEDLIPFRGAKPVAGIMVRRMIGEETADLLGIQGHYPWQARVLFRALLGTIRPSEGIAEKMRGGNWIARFFIKILAKRINKDLKDKAFEGSPPLHLPDHLLEKWGFDRQ